MHRGSASHLPRAASANFRLRRTHDIANRWTASADEGAYDMVTGSTTRLFLVRRRRRSSRPPNIPSGSTPLRTTWDRRTGRSGGGPAAEGGTLAARCVHVVLGETGSTPIMIYFRCSAHPRAAFFAASPPILALFFSFQRPPSSFPPSFSPSPAPSAHLPSR